MPEKTDSRTRDIENTYLREGLQEKANALGRVIIIGDYICDENDGIAAKNAGGAYKGLKNELDWKLFQYLASQSDAIITGSDYLKRVQEMGLEKAQNVLNQFSVGQFSFLGDLREKNGLKRNPDVIVIGRKLDFIIPDGLINDDRKFIVFTTNSSALSSNAEDLKRHGAIVIPAGTKDDQGVDGLKISNYLNKETIYKVVKMMTGPRVLKILMDAKVLDVLYITRVHKEIPEDPSNIVRILVDGGKVFERPDLELVRKIEGPEVGLGDGTTAKEDFETYINKNLPDQDKKILVFT